MPGRSRNTKKLAQRIDLNYFKRFYPIARWRRDITLALLGIAALWIGWEAFGGRQRGFSAGPLSPSHAMLANNCTACHTPKFTFAKKVTDGGCRACHDGPVHHAGQTFMPPCADCHLEHQGPFRTANIRSQTCTQCHADLKDKNGVESKITGFASGHPEFAVVKNPDPGAIRFNHQIHLADYVRGPRGAVHLECSDCHARERGQMLRIDYKKHCAACHPLTVDPRVSEPAPHDTPAVVADFLATRLPPMNTAMWKKACEQCHTLTFSSPMAVPVVAASQIPARWFQHASFDHDIHLKVACTNCHPRAPTSAVSADVLLPGIDKCRACHQSSTCSECHSYHDWTKGRKVIGVSNFH
jgi:hypothetical protein